jgi:hypothetical protein
MKTRNRPKFYRCPTELTLIERGLVLKKRAPGQTRIAVYVPTDPARSLEDNLSDLYVR